MDKDEALKLALEALEGVLDDSHKVLEASISGGLYEVVQCRDAITAIKQALALDKMADNARDLGLDYEPVLKDNSNYRLDPPVAEPVVFYRCNGCGHAYEQVHPTSCDCMESGGFDRVEYYTTPPAAQRQWVGLTDDERLEVAEIDGADEWFWKVCKAIEAKLKEKNT